MAIHIHLGITGLRRTGKTVFLTTLIHHLETLGNSGMKAFSQPNTLNRIELLPATVHSPNGNGPRPFPYQDFVEGLRRDPPEWPESTSLSSHLELVFQTVNPSRSTWDPRRNRTVHLHLYDYPGEFLLDIPMHNQDFRRWSKETLDRMKSNQGNLPEVQAYLERANILDHQDTAAEADELRHLYANYVVAAWKARYEVVTPAMTLVDPERNVRELSADQLAQERYLPFIPVPDVSPCFARLDHFFDPTFRKYRDEKVWPFLKQLRRCQEQLVLVDVLRILQQGPRSYNDVRAYLASVLSAYRYAGWFSSGIRRVLFAATKADHATVNDRANLVALMKSAVQQARGQIPARIMTNEYYYLASVRGTEDRDGEYQGRPIHALYGVLADNLDEKPRCHNPGIVPSSWNIKDWSVDDPRYQFPRFQSRGFPQVAGVTWDYLGIDQIIHDLVKKYL